MPLKQRSKLILSIMCLSHKQISKDFSLGCFGASITEAMIKFLLFIFVKVHFHNRVHRMNIKEANKN